MRNGNSYCAGIMVLLGCCVTECGSYDVLLTVIQRRDNLWV